jgi:hypothetical protein
MSTGAKSTKNCCLAARLEVGHVDDRERQRAARHELADRLAREACSGTCPRGPPRMWNGRPGRLPSALEVRPHQSDLIGSRMQTRAPAGDDLLDRELRGRRLAAAGLAEDRDVLPIFSTCSPFFSPWHFSTGCSSVPGFRNVQPIRRVTVFVRLRI